VIGEANVLFAETVQNRVIPFSLFAGVEVTRHPETLSTVDLPNFSAAEGEMLEYVAEFILVAENHLPPSHLILSVRVDISVNKHRTKISSKEPQDDWKYPQEKHGKIREIYDESVRTSTFSDFFT
jgi:GTP-dependent phosphoenolpyruvate carboxykinase